MPLIESQNNNLMYMSLKSSKPKVFEQFESDPSKEIQPYGYNEQEIHNKYIHRAPKYIAIASMTGLILAFTSPSIRFKILNSVKNIAGSDYQLINPFNKDLDALTKLEVGAKRINNQFFDKLMNLLYNIDHLKNHATGIIANKFTDLGTLINKINVRLEPKFYGAVTNTMKAHYTSVGEAHKSLETSILGIISKDSTEYKAISPLLENLHKSLDTFVSPTNLEKRIGEWFNILEETAKEYKTQIADVFRDKNFSLLANKPISFSILNEKKLNFAENLFELSRKISFSPKNKINLLKYIQNEIINGNDVLIEKFIPRIKSVIADLAKNDIKDNKIIINLLEDLSNYQNKPKSLDGILKISKNVFSENKEGNLEVLLSELEALASKGKITESSLKTVKDQAGKLTKRLQEALDFEIEKMTGRMLDLKIGPTPFLEASALSILPLVLLKTMINEEDCFEEKISKVIKYTPPIVGGLWGIIFSLKRGIFGAKAVLFGVFTGWIFHQIGNYVDDKFYTKGREFNVEKSLNTQQLSNTRFNIQEF